MTPIPTFPVRLARLTAAAALALGLGACAVFTPVTPGMTQAEVIAHSGKPSAIVPLPSGTRLQYSLQPAGQNVSMVDLDASGRVVSVREVMTPAAFAMVQVDRWTQDDVLREFGRPAKIDRVYSWDGDIMTYRWKDGSVDMLFFVYLDPGKVVRKTGQGMDIPISLFRSF